MVLTICRRGDTLIGEVRFDHGKLKRVTITSLLALGEDVNRLLKPLVPRLTLLSPTTATHCLHVLRWLGDGFVALGINRLPRDESMWQQLVLRIHEFVLTRPDRQVSLRTRNSGIWDRIRGFFSILAEDGLIPVSVQLPLTRTKLDAIDIYPYQPQLLGAHPPQVVTDAELDKLLLPVNFARTDAEYLEEVRDQLAFRRRILFEALCDYWRTLKANYDFGKHLREGVDWPQLKAELDAYQPGRPHPANPLRGREGLANYLCVCSREQNGRLCATPTRSRLQRASYAPLFGPDSGLALPPNFAGRYQSAHRQAVLWWLGQIVPLDVVMICSLLIMLHPSWTPYSLLCARLRNADGKLHLQFADGGMTFTIEKARAKAVKTERLTDLSFEIITTLVEMSTPLREALAAQGDSKASLLFLPLVHNHVSLVSPEAGAEILGGKNARKHSVWIGTLYPELVAQGLGVGTMSFSKIRRTEGVLEWFRTGSLRAVSKKLGNTERVVLEHYLPKPLLDAWNTRMIRRFQNLWIAVATAHEDFLLEVTDFSNRADLHAFLVHMLQLHSRTSSPLAELLHDSFDAAQPERAEGHLHIAIGKASLSALYAYQATALEAGLPSSALDRRDVLTGLSPRHFLTLADLLQACLPADKNPSIRAAHEAALQFAADPIRRPNWGRLFTQMEGPLNA